jgi:hypothetical protein
MKFINPLNCPLLFDAGTHFSRIAFTREINTHFIILHPLVEFRAALSNLIWMNRVHLNMRHLSSSSIAGSTGLQVQNSIYGTLVHHRTFHSIRSPSPRVSNPMEDPPSTKMEFWTCRPVLPAMLLEERCRIFRCTRFIHIRLLNAARNSTRGWRIIKCVFISRVNAIREKCVPASKSKGQLRGFMNFMYSLPMRKPHGEKLSIEY